MSHVRNEATVKIGACWRVAPTMDRFSDWCEDNIGGPASAAKVDNSGLATPIAEARSQQSAPLPSECRRVQRNRRVGVMTRLVTSPKLEAMQRRSLQDGLELAMA